MSKKNSKKPQPPIPRRVSDIPVTTRHLELVKQELKSDITTLRLETKSGFTKMEADMSHVKSAVFQMQALLEEQNSRNRIALDGYAAVYEKQTSI